MGASFLVSGCWPGNYGRVRLVSVALRSRTCAAAARVPGGLASVAAMARAYRAADGRPLPGYGLADTPLGARNALPGASPTLKAWSTGPARAVSGRRSRPASRAPLRRARAGCGAGGSTWWPSPTRSSRSSPSAVTNSALGTQNARHGHHYALGCRLLLVSFVLCAPLLLRNRFPLSAWSASALAMILTGLLIPPHSLDAAAYSRPGSSSTACACTRSPSAARRGWWSARAPSRLPVRSSPTRDQRGRRHPHGGPDPRRGHRPVPAQQP